MADSPAGSNVKHVPRWMQHLETMLETLNQGAMLVSPDAEILYANATLSEMVGMPQDDFLGRGAADFYCGADLEYIMAKRASGVTAQQFEFFLPRVEGHSIPVVIAARRISSPDGDLFTVVTYTDITEQKDAQTALHKANKRLEENQRQLDTELALAARVQQSLAPRSASWDGANVETFYAPVHTIGGDFGLAEAAAGRGTGPASEPHLNLLVCDVSGHGIGSALIANRIYTETVSLLERQHDLGLMLHKLNRMVLDHIQLNGFFFTMAAARLDRNRRLSFAGAGHPPAFWVSRNAKGEATCRTLNSRSGALGIVDDAVVENPIEEVEMAAGDRLILCTDGVTEVFNERREMLDYDGLARIIIAHSAKPLAEMKQAVVDEVAAWRYGPVTDDMSLVLVEVT